MTPWIHTTVARRFYLLSGLLHLLEMLYQKPVLWVDCVCGGGLLWCDQTFYCLVHLLLLASSSVVAGTPQEFLIERRDGFENEDKGEICWFLGWSVFGQSQVSKSKGSITSNRNGTMRVTNVPITSGTYLLALTVGSMSSHSDWGYFE